MSNRHTVYKCFFRWYLLGLCIAPCVELHAARISTKQAARISAKTTTTPAALKRIESDTNRSVVQELQTLQKAFGTPRGFDSFKNSTITLDYQHIFGMNFDFKNSKTIILNGFHHDNKNQVEKSGIIKFSLKGKNKHGYYRAALLYQGIHLGTKNFFPASWPRTKVVSKIREAYNNALKCGSKIAKRSDGSFEILGTTQEGVIIRMFLNTRGVIFTAYPSKV